MEFIIFVSSIISITFFIYFWIWLATVKRLMTNAVKMLTAWATGVEDLRKRVDNA